MCFLYCTKLHINGYSMHTIQGFINITILILTFRKNNQRSVHIYTLYVFLQQLRYFNDYCGLTRNRPKSVHKFSNCMAKPRRKLKI